MEPKFTIQPDGVVSISLPTEWDWLTQALEDCFATRPPKGSSDATPLTYWIDGALDLMQRSDGSTIELSSGNMSRFSLSGTTVTTSADYDTFADYEMPTWVFSGLLKQWRAATLIASSQREDAYDDDYPTCARTHASLRLFSEELSPAAITHLLEADPTGGYTKGDPVGRLGGERSTNAWILGSESSVQSADLARHIDWVLDQVNEIELSSLSQGERAQVDVFCYWASFSGHGGPRLEPGLMLRLANLGLPVGVDVYFPG